MGILHEDPIQSYLEKEVNALQGACCQWAAAGITGKISTGFSCTLGRGVYWVWMTHSIHTWCNDANYYQHLIEPHPKIIEHLPYYCWFLEVLIFPLIRDFLSYLDFVGRHFCEGVIVSEHIPNGEHDCVWFKIISLAKPMLSHFKHFLIITLVLPMWRSSPQGIHFNIICVAYMPQNLHWSTSVFRIYTYLLM